MTFPSPPTTPCPFAREPPSRAAGAGGGARADAARPACARPRADDAGAPVERAGAAEEQRPRPVHDAGLVRLPAPPGRRLVPDRPARDGPRRGVRRRHRRRPGVQRALGRQRHRARKRRSLLSVLSGNEALYVAVRNSARPLGLAFNVGMRLPAYLSGSGKAMLAQLPADEVRRRFTGQLSTRLTSKGPRDIESLLKELALTRKRGYSIDDEAVREGVYSFGAPVFDASGEAVAAVAVCINKAQLGSDRGARHRDAALDVARRLTQRLGGASRTAHPAFARRGPDERRRLHPRDARAHQGVQGLRRRRQGQPARAPRHDPRADRPERRRQDDLLQPAHQVPDADRRARSSSRASTSRTRSRRQSRAAASSARSRSRRCSRT